MYRLEFFTDQMVFASACYTSDAQTIALDYLVYDQFSIETQIIDVKKGYFVHITRDNALVADGIVASVQPNKTTQEISIRPLQALFDVEVYYNAVSDAILWIATNITNALVSNADTSQNRPINVTYTQSGQNLPLTGYNFNKTTNILSVIATAFKTYNVVTECSLNMSTKKIDVNVYEQTATKTVECDLDNVFGLEVSLGESYGSTNKYTVKKTGVISGTTEITYYLHPDGSIDTTSSDRITPVFWELDTLDATEEMTDAEWIAETETMAKEAMALTSIDNEVILSVGEDDKIVRPLETALGTKTTILLHGNTYSSIYTGYSRSGSIVTMTFGGLRKELTKQLAMGGGATIVNQSSGSGSASLTFDDIYPVGSVYMSVNSTSPATLFGGTWEQIAQGRALFGEGSVTNTYTINGTSTTVTNTYTAGQTVDAGVPNVSGSIGRIYNDFNKGNTQYHDYVTNPFYYLDNEEWGSKSNLLSGSNDAVRQTYMDLSTSNSIFGSSNTVQPNAYVLYVWKRTA